MSAELTHFPQLTIGTSDVNEDYAFNNGYGISVIRHHGSYGYTSGLFEVAFLGQDGNIAAHPEILPNSVEGWLTVEDVLGYAQKIAALPSPQSALESKNIGELEG